MVPTKRILQFSRSETKTQEKEVDRKTGGTKVCKKGGKTNRAEEKTTGCPLGKRRGVGKALPGKSHLGSGEVNLGKNWGRGVVGDWKKTSNQALVEKNKKKRFIFGHGMIKMHKKGPKTWGGQEYTGLEKNNAWIHHYQSKGSKEKEAGGQGKGVRAGGLARKKRAEALKIRKSRKIPRASGRKDDSNQPPGVANPSRQKTPLGPEVANWKVVERRRPKQALRLSARRGNGDKKRPGAAMEEEGGESKPGNLGMFGGEAINGKSKRVGSYSTPPPQKKKQKKKNTKSQRAAGSENERGNGHECKHRPRLPSTSW